MNVTAVGTYSRTLRRAIEYRAKMSMDLDMFENRIAVNPSDLYRFEIWIGLQGNLGHIKRNASGKVRLWL